MVIVPFLIALLVFIIFLFIFKTQRCLPVSSTTRCLLVIAHPDDETMFFGPTVTRLARKGCLLYILCITSGDADGLARKGCLLYILCITSGDADGLGTIRKRELIKAVTKLGMYSENLTILDMEDYPDGNKCKWEMEKLSRIILQYIEKLDINIVISFDVVTVPLYKWSNSY
uniref:N-acetylglucosaminylphosphatidylinositol deacetylase n=1 Tax=Acrobeloides nanus TaxID=290746 RepID=A0A914ENF7_9BILA